MPQADLNHSYLSFNNSSINLIHNDNYTIDYTDDPEGVRIARDPSAWDGDFFVGQTWAGAKLPNNFVRGNNSSTFNFWNGTEYVEWADAPPGSIWQSNRNPNSLRTYQLGATGVNNFLNLSSFVDDLSWLGGTGGTGAWAATGGTNWNNGPWNAAMTAKFAGTPGTVTVDVGGVAANKGLEFAVGGYTLTGAAVTLGGANAAANTIKTLAGTTTINAPLAGSAGLTKAGAGVLVLGGSNTFSGGVTVRAGTLAVGADENLGDASGGITLGGGTLEMTSSFTLGSGRTITAVASTTSTLAVTSGTVSYGGAFTGSGNLDKAGAGRLVVSNASSGYTGLFTVSAGTLEVTGANAFANASLRQTGGELLLAPVGGGDVTIPDLDGSGGTLTVAENVTAVVGGATNSTYGGQITGQGGLRKEGAGDLRLNGTNDFSGALQIAVGRLILGFDGTLSATPLIEIGSGAIFDLTERTSPFVLGNGQQLGGEGTVLGDLEFGSGALLAFNPTATLLVGSGMISFASGFGIANIVGLNSSTEFGTYTLLDEIEEGFISFSDLANVGLDNAVDIGGGKLAYFQEGSLQLVVVPEPSTALLGGLGLAIASWSVCRRHRRVLQ
jgi:autotransporter-associated beta strand protein